jgi:membrane-bound lytic murein transglycosylase A
MGAALPSAGRDGRAAAPIRPLDFAELKGWNSEDHGAALSAFRETCDLLADSAWQEIRNAAASAKDARCFFETFFRPVLVGSGTEALFTGYYEPELAGARARSDGFPAPIYRAPPDLPADAPWHTRREIEERGLLSGCGLEIAWLKDRVEAFFLQVQGSGRIRFDDGQTIRVGYAARNGHEYRSIGTEMIRRGLLPQEQISAQSIKAWLRRNPGQADDLMRHNPSFVFFRDLPDLRPELGPLGAMGRPVTALRSIAVDPAHVPLGTPVWIETRGPEPLNRLMVAQDTGSAIRGPHRADIFFGTGEGAGQRAGRLRDHGRMVLLLPAAAVGTILSGV